MKKIKYGIMGFGSFAERRLIPGFQKSKIAEVIAITKRDAAKAKARARHFNIAHSYAHADKNAFLETPDMDAVFVASSNNMHLEDTIACLTGGKHVLLEKPMGMNAKECEIMIDAAKDNELELMIAHCLRFNSTVAHFKTIVEENRLGKLISGKCDFFSDGTKSSRTWKYDKHIAGGGAAFDLGVHIIDTIRFITGKAIENVNCISVPKNRASNKVDEVATFLLDFEGEFSASCVSSFRGTRNLLLELFGEKGYIRAYDWNENFESIRVESEIDGNFQRYEIENEDMYTKEIDTFARCIMGETRNPVPGKEGLINQKIIDLVND